MKTRHIEISIKDENQKVLFSTMVNVKDIRKIEEMNLDLIFMNFEDEFYLREINPYSVGGEEVIYFDIAPLEKQDY